ncbi:MAG: tetratricopeptide repeat protein [Planctomycetota bacterium]|nr:MAG: tetratricopeptide repeat protein [Planctomycetota bacterium]
MQSLEETFQTAMKCHDAGDYRQAEALYRQVLTADPQHAQATHLLGLLAYQVGKHELAVKLVSQAIRLDGAQPTFHTTLAEAYRELGKVPEAMQCYRQALRIKPDYPQAHNNLGVLVQAQGNPAEAMAHYREAVRAAPNYADAHHNLGYALQQQGQWEAAAAEFSAALRARPDYADARMALGATLQAQGKQAEAMAHFQELGKTHPDSPQVQCALGAGHQGLGNYAAAEACYRRAIQLAPTFGEAYYNLGTALHNLDRDMEAIAVYQEALKHNPQLAIAWSNLANTYLGLVRPDEAADAARKALELTPQSHTSMGNLATALQMQGDMDGAIAAFRRCIELNPGDAGNHSNLLYTLNFHPGYDAETLFAEHRAWAARHADPLTAAAAPHANDRTPDRRLRVGYVSAHFRHHAVAFFAEPMLAAHDPQQVEVVCYADLRRADAVTERFHQRAHQWRDITRLLPHQIAELVRQDQVDILVDLAGHIGDNRLLAFAHKPAPVQVTYLGYQNTTGMAAMDYRLTDAHADPPGITDAYYTEQLVRLPGAFFCFAPPEPAPPLVAPPSQREGRVTFASLNHIHKLTDEAFRVWARILQRVPDSRLVVLAYPEGVLAKRVRDLLAGEGVDPGRVEVVGKRPRYDYLLMHDHIDIALDTFPFNGHTTVCDALWMGVPSIMMEGDRYASRFGGSTLLGVGLDDLIARDAETYVEKAVALAQDGARLAELRATLRERMQASPLVDAKSFTQKLENAYRQMWHTWCAK